MPEGKTGVPTVSGATGLKKLQAALIATMCAVVQVSCALPSAAQDSLRATTARPYPRILFSDGAIATPAERCALGDVCATLVYPDGDQMIVLNEGAAKCEPYVLRFIRMHGLVSLTSFGVKTTKADRCSDNFINTWLTLDRGLVRLGVFQHPDGSLFLKFEPADAPPDKR